MPIERVFAQLFVPFAIEGETSKHPFEDAAGLPVHSALAHQVEGLGPECWQFPEPPAYDGIRHQGLGLDPPHGHAEMLPPPHDHHIVTRCDTLNLIGALVC